MSTTIPILKNEKDQRHYKAGDVIFQTGDIGGLMFGVIDGVVEVSMHERIVETVEAGGVVGEVSLVDDGPRSATAIAKTDCLLAAIDNHRFMLMVAQNPWFSLQVMRILADRLRRWGV
jgi:CRP/FNR family cyclic AMP-dependent transcriptional regulator